MKPDRGTREKDSWSLHTVVGGIVSCAALFGPFGRQTMVRVKGYLQFGRYWAMVYSIEVQLVQLLLLINPRLPLPAVAETR